MSRRRPILATTPPALSPFPHSFSNSISVFSIFFPPQLFLCVLTCEWCSDKNNGKTFRPNKKHDKGTKRYNLHKQAKATLGTGNLRLAVKLPQGEDLNEWLAVNTVDFFNQLNLLYGSITEFCTPTACPVMSAGPKYEYLWADDNTKKPVKCSAPEYVDYLMTWVQVPRLVLLSLRLHSLPSSQSQLDNEAVFPSRVDVPFPKHFQSVVKTIFKRLFRIYAHIYYSHFNKIMALGEEAHLNTTFKHFYYFIDEFDLVDKKELAPLQELITNLTSRDAK